MKTIKKSATSEITEKKSKFIGEVFYIQSIQKAEQKIEEVNKKYHDANHHCFAYRILEENNIKERCSDDGEPNGTAGAPILQLLSKNELVNVLVIVTRYFGGILLGTGGLVRAYSKTASEVLKEAGFTMAFAGWRTKVRVGSNKYALPRYGVINTTWVSDIEKIIN